MNERKPSAIYFYLVCILLLKFNHNSFETEEGRLVFHIFSIHFTTIDIYNFLVLLIYSMLIKIGGMVYIKNNSTEYL